MTRPNEGAPTTPENAAPESSCDSCGRPLERVHASRVFRTWHERCLARAVREARAEVRDD